MRSPIRDRIELAIPIGYSMGYSLYVIITDYDIFVVN